MASVVLDELDLGFDHLNIHVGLNFAKALMQQGYVVFVGGTLAPEGRSNARMLQYKSSLVELLGLRVSSQGDGVDLRQCAAGLLQTEFDGLTGEPSPVLDASKPLFFGGGKQHAINKNGRRGICVVGVQSKDNLRHSVLFGLSPKLQFGALENIRIEAFLKFCGWLKKSSSMGSKLKVDELVDWSQKDKDK